MTDEQRVTDEQLTAWDAAIAGRRLKPEGEWIAALIADLRASRTEAAEAYTVGFEQCRRRAVAAEAERDGLQQRIDKAVAELNAPPIVVSMRSMVEYRSGVSLRRLRTALTGTDTDHG